MRLIYLKVEILVTVVIVIPLYTLTGQPELLGLARGVLDDEVTLPVAGSIIVSVLISASQMKYYIQKYSHAGQRAFIAV